MLIYPSLDLMNGNFVRLKQGDFNQATTYGSDPVAKAKEYVEAGAKRIHVVDLDAARTGVSSNEAQIEAIIKETGLFVQTGGGVRCLTDIERKLKLGASRVIIGTAAVKNPNFAAQAVKQFGDAVVVGIDAKAGIAATDGWTDYGAAVNAVVLAIQMAAVGVKTIVYTDIAKDGMMEGSNVRDTANIIQALTAASKMPFCANTGQPLHVEGTPLITQIIASGGISSMDDLHALAGIGASGAILGKALFTGALDLKTVIDTFER